MKRSLVGLAVVSLLFAGVAGAAVQKGDTEIEALGSYQNWNSPWDDGDDMTAWSIAAGLGYFVTDNIRVGVAGTYSDADYQFMVPTELKKWGIGVNVKYHFMPGNLLVPYIGAQVGWENWDVTQSGEFDVPDGDGEETIAWEDSGSTDGILYGPLAGVRYELNPNNDIFFEFQYNFYANDISDDLAEDGYAIFVGIVHQFK